MTNFDDEFKGNYFIIPSGSLLSGDVNWTTTHTIHFHQALQVKKLDPAASAPQKAHSSDLGYDLFSLRDVTLPPDTVTKVHTGIACGFPAGYGALLRDRSSIATKKAVFVVAGVIDQEYTGEIIIAFHNPNGFPVHFKAGDKIAQMILVPVITFDVEEVDVLTNTLRGAGGFGSTGT